MVLQKKGDEGELVNLAGKAIEVLAQVGNTAGDRQSQANSGAEADAGQGLGSGELPAAQATVLYVLRVGVIEQMGETGQVSCSSIIFSLSSKRHVIPFHITPLPGYGVGIQSQRQSCLCQLSKQGPEFQAHT